MNKLSFLFILFLLPLKSFSKEQAEKLFFVELNKQAQGFNEDDNFFKMTLFFTNNQWDSVIVFSFKTLISHNLPNDIADYAHYCRAFSFMKKKLFEESTKEFQRVSSKFQFYYNVQRHLGENALEQKKFTEALCYFEPLEKLSNTQQYDFNKSVLLHNIGITYLHMENYAKAEEYLFKCVALQQLQKDTLRLIGTYMDIANNYYEQYKDALAIPYFERAYLLSKIVNDFEAKQNASQGMAVVEENKKRFDKALAYRKEFEIWKDSLNNQNKVWELAEFEKKFAINQKQEEVNHLETQNKLKAIQRNSLFASSILLILLLATGAYFFVQKIKRNKVILTQKLELDQLNATKDKLFSIVSHDLRSSVNALKTSNAQLIENLNSKNLEAVSSLLNQNSSIANGAYNLLDNLLNWALVQTKQAYFHQDSLHLYSICEQVAFNYKPLMLNKNIQFENTISKSIFVFADQDSLKIILRNLLDNAIKFSLQSGMIKMYVQSSSDTHHHLIIEDNGIGMNELIRQELMTRKRFIIKEKK